MTTPEHEVNPAGDGAYQELIASASREMELGINHPYVLALAEARYRAAVYKDALSAAEEALRYKDQELEALIYDHNTGVLLYDPAIKLGNLLLDEIKRNLNSTDVNEPQTINALMAIGIDVEALHLINNRWGGPTGDAAINDAANTLVDAADLLNASFRTHERRDHIWRRGEVPRHTDIIARRKKGDELFALIAFHESEEFRREDMRTKAEKRLNNARRHNGKRLYLHSSIAFYDPGRDENVEDLLDRADPKTTTRGERVARGLRKILRSATARY